MNKKTPLAVGAVYVRRRRGGRQYTLLDILTVKYKQPAVKGANDLVVGSLPSVVYRDNETLRVYVRGSREFAVKFSPLSAYELQRQAVSQDAPQPGGVK